LTTKIITGRRTTISISSLETRWVRDWRCHWCGGGRNPVDSEDERTFALKCLLGDFWFDDLWNLSWGRDFDFLHLRHCFRLRWNYHLTHHASCKSNSHIVPITTF
jgi:hypothetical protein